MIASKADLKSYIQKDMSFYHRYSSKDKLILKFIQDPAYQIVQYLRFLRKEEYYFNTKNNLFKKFMYYYFLNKKNALGNKLGFKIPKNCFGPGLTIYHHGNIIINESAKIGSNCHLHGNNCIGNDGKVDIAPRIGDNLNLGFGACIIGDVSLGNNITIGANAVVIKSALDNAVTLVGIPARKI